MGCNLKDLVESKEITFEELKGKTLAIDSFNMLYQFLTTIRQKDGSPLLDSNGNITSHLNGLFNRIVNFLDKGLMPIFIFDGIPPDLKQKEIEKRRMLKEDAIQKYNDAKQAEDVDEMNKYSGRSVRLTKEMVNEAKELISAFGIPYIEAKSEGEAQAALLVRRGEAFAVVSQDYDGLLYGGTNLIKNLSIAGKRKKTNKLAYETVKPEIINLPNLLNSLNIDMDQLIALSMLVGTDFNPSGIKGIGPKKALKLVKEYGKDLDGLFKHVDWDNTFDIEWKKVFELIKNIPTTDDYKIIWNNINKQKIVNILCVEHDFSEERVLNMLSKLDKKENKQKSLGDFF